MRKLLRKTECKLCWSLGRLPKSLWYTEYPIWLELYQWLWQSWKYFWRHLSMWTKVADLREKKKLLVIEIKLSYMIIQGNFMFSIKYMLKTVFSGIKIVSIFYLVTIPLCCLYDSNIVELVDPFLTLKYLSTIFGSVMSTNFPSCNGLSNLTVSLLLLTLTIRALCP